jgi:geranylgeranyl reductase family protein
VARKGRTARKGFVADVAVVGGGPGGTAAAARLASAGLDTVVLEKFTYPREKVCGDGITPRAVKALLDLGMSDKCSTYHRVDGLRAIGYGQRLELPWPEHSIYPSYGLTAPRSVLDSDLAELARRSGAAVLEGHEAIKPVLSDGILTGLGVLDKATGKESVIEAEFFVVADGSLSRIGRMLGTARDRSHPMGLAMRGYYASPKDRDPWIESRLDLSHEGKRLPAYGWIFPLGDGSVNAGVGMLTSYAGWKEVNTGKLQDRLIAEIATDWAIGPSDAIGKPKGGKLPMGLSIYPKAGANWLAVGDAAAGINAFTGEGIGYALEMAEIAADLIVDAKRRSSALSPTRYAEILQDFYGPYYKAARLFAYLIGKPRLLEFFGRVGMRSTGIMTWFLIVAGHLGDRLDRGTVSRLYYSIEKVVKAFPSVAA